jgi:cobalt/nickel transport system permease protein
LDWLFKEENYTPQKDKDAFLDKSILSILTVLSKIQRDSSAKRRKTGDGSPQPPIIYRINPQLKFLSSIVFIILVSISHSVGFIALSAFLVILMTAMLDKEDKKKMASLMAFVLIFTLIILLPSMLMGNVKNALIMLIKVIEGVTIVNVVSYSTKWHEVTKSLKLLYIPDIFIFVMDITIRYIFLLGEICLDMLYALKCRSIGRNNKKYTSMSGVIGNLFLKSKDMGDEMYAAMECRGFTGEYSAGKMQKLQSIDYVYLGFFVAFLVAWLKL